MDSFDALLAEAAAAPTSGWDFSWLGARLRTRPLPWDYDAVVRERARSSPDLLDLGTGGGERLARLTDRSARTVATEAWAPNVPIASARLRPLGVAVVQVAGAPDNVDQVPNERRGPLPFRDGTFHLVAARHEAFVAGEVARILAPGGAFVTQQVGTGSYDDLHRALGLTLPVQHGRAWELPLAEAQVRGAGLELVRSDAAADVMAFADIGALAWYLRMVSWAIPGFSPARHRRQLRALHTRMQTKGPLLVRQPRFWLEARKSPSAG